MEFIEFLKNIFLKEINLLFTIFIVLTGMSILSLKEFLSEWWSAGCWIFRWLFSALFWGALSVNLFIHTFSTETIFPSLIFIFFGGIAVLLFRNFFLICFNKSSSKMFYESLGWGLFFGLITLTIYDKHKELDLIISFGFLLSFFLHFLYMKMFDFFSLIKLFFHVKREQHQYELSYRPFITVMLRFFKKNSVTVDDLKKYVEEKKSLIHEVKYEKIIQKIFIKDVRNFCNKEPLLKSQAKQSSTFLKELKYTPELHFKKFNNDTIKFLDSYQSCFKEIKGFEFDKHLNNLQIVYNKWKRQEEMKLKNDIEKLIKDVNKTQQLANQAVEIARTTKQKKEIELKKATEAEQNAIKTANIEEHKLVTEQKIAAEKKAKQLELERQHKINEFPLETHLSAFVGRLAELNDSMKTENHDKFIELYESMNNRFKELGLVPLDQLLYISNDAHLLNQKAIIIDLFAEKIKRVKQDTLIDEEEQFMKIELWRRIQDRYLNQLA